MSRIYTASYAGTLTNAGGNSDWVSIQPANDKPVRLLGMVFGQTSEVGDAAEESLNINILRLPATFTVGSGGSAITPAAMDATDNVACGATVRCNDTTVSTTSGSIVTLAELAWNIRMSPYDFWFPDVRFCPIVRQAEGLVVRCATTLADDASGTLTFWLEEF